MGQPRRPFGLIALSAAALALGAPAVGSAAPAFKRITTIGVGPFPSYGMARTSNGVLHLVYQTTASGSASPNGLAARTISPSGKLGPQVQALSGWGAGLPGLVLLPDGTLEAAFGAISPNQVSGVWGIASTDGGATWSAPGNVGTNDSNESLAYGANVTAVFAGGAPVLTLPQAGGLVVQRGLGPGSTTQLVTDSSDNFAGDVDSTVDAGTDTAVAGWQSLAGAGGDFIQAVSPTVGAAQKVPGQLRNEIVISGRDQGAGVFAAYTTDGTHVRLQRYGGGSVAVGKKKGLTAAKLGTATGIGGRIWVMWGQDGAGVALTRSNKAVTKFEPIQRVQPKSFTLHRLAGDGRLGPLDLLVDQIPESKGSVPPAGTFYARVLPILSASISVKSHKLKVTVTDAGDPVSSATVAALGKKAKTNAAGAATITLPKSATGKITVTITAAGYKTLKETVKV